MKKILAIAVFELKKVFKNPHSYILMFGMPLLFTLIFGGLLTNGEEVKPSIIVVDNDESRLSQAFIDDVKNKNFMSVSIASFEHADTEFNDSNISGYVQIDRGFEEKMLKGESPVILFKHSPSFNGTIMVNQILTNSVKRVKIGATASMAYSAITGDNKENIHEDILSELVATSNGIEITLITKSEELVTMNNMSARSAGFTIMFVMMATLISTGVILEAKQTGVWYRLMSTPIAKLELILGYLLAFFLIGWVQFGILMLASTVLFDVYWGNILGNIVLISSILLSTIGIGLFIAGLVRTTEQQAVFGNLVIISTCMLGGVFWPLEIVPDFMLQVAKFVPQYWALEGFTELAVRGGTVVDILGQIIILLAFTVLFLGVGLTRVRFE
ncbi:ABC transporter permease subunit [Aquibacillus halophilus]|uniref:ABC transporter permease subunit n=1 Tax=Aquibacillus halophilus TaxID=930132 RepID=A0A6A8DH89_9BACI|nr:ABC transporter permease [Aquibacillus halophilus]MRH45068.1 ABC transporter permease subunit [Aquibacillus halophilus]